MRYESLGTRLKLGRFLAVAVILFTIGTVSRTVFSLDAPPAVPVAEVEIEKLAPPVLSAPLPKAQETTQDQSPAAPISNAGQAPPPVVVELFSTQACSFCPKADALLGELARTPGVIALSCHVDYFDVKAGSLSHPFCSGRQVSYESTLRAGPKYTPQMVVNGQYDVVGYRRSDVFTTIRRARKQSTLVTPTLKPEPGSKIFVLSLPALSNSLQEGAAEMASTEAAYQIFLLVYDKPHTIKVAEGANAGQSIVYTNVVRNVGLLGSWGGEAQNFRFDPKLTEQSQGFAVLVGSPVDGHIIAAAQYIKAL